jgi:tRNA G18 (ribose-2'-O)-methylase SpoU
VVLDKPTIAGNVGAIIRTAIALGAGGIVLLNSAGDCYDRRL